MQQHQIEASEAHGHFHQMEISSVEIICTKNQALCSQFILLHSCWLAFQMLLMTAVVIQAVFQSCLYTCHVVYIIGGAEKLCMVL